jgi:glycosyltransferase involved in cell wall biosynthesis
MAAQGFALLVIRSSPTGGAGKARARLESTGIIVRQFRLPPWRRLLMALYRRLYLWKPALRRVIRYDPFGRLFRSFGADLAVICQGDTYDGIVRFTNTAQACAKAGLPYVMVCQKAYDDLWPSDADRAAIKRAYLNAKRVFFVSERNWQCTQRQLALSLPNAEVIANPSVVKVDQPLPWPAETMPKTWRLACVARLWARDKGQDMLLSVLSRPEWRERPLEVNFFGDGDTARGLQELAEMLELANVRFRGFAQDVTKVWRDHHALVLPSRHEGLPLALIEAMQCGRFGIVTDVGGNAEVINDGSSGFVAPEASVAGINEAMERAWLRRHEWEQIGAEAAREIRQRIPADPCEVFAEKLGALHAEVTGTARAAAGRASPQVAVR